jgi:hypothetical protein
VRLCEPVLPRKWAYGVLGGTGVVVVVVSSRQEKGAQIGSLELGGALVLCRFPKFGLGNHIAREAKPTP